MSRYEILFYTNHEQGDWGCIKCLQLGNEINITIFDPDNPQDRKTVILDKSTAIKFSKTLRTEINTIEEEGSND